MKIACVSDLHGHLPNLSNLEFDILLIAGDIGPHPARNYTRQKYFYEFQFKKWLESIKVPVIGVAGNHDFIFQNHPELLPDLPWTYLQDTGTTLLNGMNVWGSPWQPPFYDWAFNMDEFELVEKWNLIPDDTDILLTHGPPLNIGDYSPYGNTHAGSYSLLERVLALKPKLHVFGHLHSGYGRYDIYGTIFVNAAQVDEEYKPTRQPIIVEI